MDERGRILIPKKFRRIIEKKYGKDVILILVDRKIILIFPMPEWEKMISRVNGDAEKNPILKEVKVRMAYFCKKAMIDNHGRILIPRSLRDEARLEGDIIIEGKGNHLSLSSKS